MATLYVLTDGSGEDGDEVCWLGIYTTYELAEQARKRYRQKRIRPDGTWYRPGDRAEIEEWVANQDAFESRSPDLLESYGDEFTV